MKVLGILWDQNSYTMMLDLSVMTAEASLEQVAKRSILSSIARFYDPLGIISPVIVPLKQLFLDICKMKVNWDAQLPQEISYKWSELMLDIAENALVDIRAAFKSVGALSPDLNAIKNLFIIQTYSFKGTISNDSSFSSLTIFLGYLYFLVIYTRKFD